MACRDCICKKCVDKCDRCDYCGGNLTLKECRDFFDGIDEYWDEDIEWLEDEW